MNFGKFIFFWGVCEDLKMENGSRLFLGSLPPSLRGFSGLEQNNFTDPSPPHVVLFSLRGVPFSIFKSIRFAFLV